MTRRAWVLSVTLTALLAGCTSAEPSPDEEPHAAPGETAGSADSRRLVDGEFITCARPGGDFDHEAGAKGAPTAVGAVRRLTEDFQRVRMVEDKGSTRHLYVLEFREVVAEVEVSNTGDGWVVTGVTACTEPVPAPKVEIRYPEIIGSEVPSPR